jgi:hypothetical protein
MPQDSSIVKLQVGKTIIGLALSRGAGKFRQNFPRLAGKKGSGTFSTKNRKAYGKQESFAGTFFES